MKLQFLVSKENHMGYLREVVTVATLPSTLFMTNNKLGAWLIYLLYQ